MKSYRELDNPVLLLDTIFYRKSLEVTGMNHFVSSSDFMGFERNPMKSYRELDKPKLLLDTFCLFFQNKQNTRSDIEATLCQFEWWGGDSRAIVSRTRQPSLTSRYNFLSKITRSDIYHFVSSSDGEATAEALYRELDLPHFTSRYNFLSKITCLLRNAGRLEVTLKQNFVSSSDGEATAESLYRELD